MLEKHVSSKIGKSLRRMGYWDITQTDSTRTQCSRCRQWVMTYPPKGRPDILVLHPANRNIVVEVKALKLREGGPKSFPFSEIDDSQRRWLDRWHAAGGKGYIGLGVIQEKPGNDELLGIWLVDWIDWLEMEEDMGEYQKSIPWDASRARFKAVKENNMDIPHMLAWFEMNHDQGDYWNLQEHATAAPE